MHVQGTTTAHLAIIITALVHVVLSLVVVEAAVWVGLNHKVSATNAKLRDITWEGWKLILLCKGNDNETWLSIDDR